MKTRYFLVCSSNHNPAEVEVTHKVFAFVKKHNGMFPITAISRKG